MAALGVEPFLERFEPGRLCGDRLLPLVLGPVETRSVTGIVVGEGEPCAVGDAIGGEVHTGIVRGGPRT